MTAPVRTDQRNEPRADVAHLAPAFGVYVHIPYCISRCPYCDFNTYVVRAPLAAPYAGSVTQKRRSATLLGQASGEAIEDTAPAYVDALLREAASWPRRRAGTVFFGGGTPSLLDPGLMSRLLDGLRDHFDIDPDAEITMEANPETVSKARLAAYRAAGINRISFGAQSFRAHVLATLGRAHSAARTVEAITEARAAGFDNVSLDLIYGTSGETLHDWRISLEEAIALGPEHISAYALTIEPGTAFGVAVQSGAMPAPDDDDQADKFEMALDLLAAAGYEHYEISNWARPGLASRHNLVYWTQGDYAGLGAGAHSHEHGVRWWNEKLPRTYVERSPGARAGEEKLDQRTRDEEWIELRNRLVAGVSIGELAVRTGAGLDATIAGLSDDGLAQIDDDKLVLTRRGLLLASEVAVRLCSVVPTDLRV